MATLHADHRGIRLVSLPAGENEGFEGRRHRHRRRVATGLEDPLIKMFREADTTVTSSTVPGAAHMRIRCVRL